MMGFSPVHETRLEKRTERDRGWGVQVESTNWYWFKVCWSLYFTTALAN